MIILEKQTEKKNLYHRISQNEFSECKINSLSMLSLDQFIKAENIIKKKDIKLGIFLDSDQSLDFISDKLKSLSIIQINFKSFKDGRPFSMAKKLRKYYLYEGEIRASGYILPDQYVFLLRCGFSTVEIDGDDKEDWIELYEMDEGLYYQP
tara:strand:+ start:147 stop:599 length:453 start_codon:yes stop_codon:yes gene_type:complete